MVAERVGRRRKKIENPSKQKERTKTVTYHVPGGGDKQHKVCKKAFMSIFSVTEIKFRILLSKTDGASSVVSHDKRGRKLNSGKPEEVRRRVQDHILSFPSISSHYSRAKSPPRK